VKSNKKIKTMEKIRGISFFDLSKNSFWVLEKVYPTFVMAAIRSKPDGNTGITRLITVI
jgi:hypothetical protein